MIVVGQHDGWPDVQAGPPAALAPMRLQPVSAAAAQLPGRGNSRSRTFPCCPPAVVTCTINETPKRTSAATHAAAALSSACPHHHAALEPAQNHLRARGIGRVWAWQQQCRCAERRRLQKGWGSAQACTGCVLRGLRELQAKSKPSSTSARLLPSCCFQGLPLVLDTAAVDPARAMRATHGAPGVFLQAVQLCALQRQTAGPAADNSPGAARWGTPTVVLEAVDWTAPAIALIRQCHI
jgi:hypothetical protein